MKLPGSRQKELASQPKHMICHWPNWSFCQRHWPAQPEDEDEDVPEDEDDPEAEDEDDSEFDEELELLMTHSPSCTSMLNQCGSKPMREL
jgi:hypothetical protein